MTTLGFYRDGRCNVPPPRGRACLHLVAFLGHRLPSQTNTSLFCALCPHSCAPRKNFPIGHPSLQAKLLNFGVLSRWASGKEVTTCWYEYPINPVKLWAGMLHPHPLKRPTSSSVNPKPGTSSLGHVRVSSASACVMLCDHSESIPAMHTMPVQLRYTCP
jgi:hypothetical protein